LASTKTISVIVSFRNEEQTIPKIVDRLESMFKGLPEDYEIIFVNDESTDNSLALLTQCHARNPRVKVVNLSRRFGVEPGLFAGMAYAHGDAVVMIDADLQDPPELIPDLVALWREGADVVYTVRTAREGEPRLKLLLTRVAYRLIDRFADIHIPIDAGDFRLLSRRVVDILLRLSEPNTYLRGLVQWVGLKRVPYYYVRKGRASGTSHFGVLSRGAISTLFYGITGFSAVPVYAVVVIGLVTLLVATLGALVLGLMQLFGSVPGVGAWLFAAALWLWGGLLAAIGVVGLYVTRVFRTTLGRPRFLVDNTIGIDQADISSRMPR